jgi:hypothetical protein
MGHPARQLPGLPPSRIGAPRHSHESAELSGATEYTVVRSMPRANPRVVMPRLVPRLSGSRKLVAELGHNSTESHPVGWSWAVQPGTCLTLQTGYMADSFLGLFDRCQRPFGGVTGARACPGSPQEGPGRSAATTTSPAERSAGGPCGPTWASPPHLSSDGPSCTGPAAGPGVSG